MKNPFDSRQLLAFVTLAKTGSFTQTGRELFLTQSAISHSIRTLERDAGCRLIDKVGKKILPTQAGEQLLVHAERILEEMATAREGLGAIKDWGAERLRVGASATVCQYLLPAVLREFQSSFPRARLSITPADTAQVVVMCEQSKIDLAFCIEPKEDPAFAFEHLFWDELVFLLSPQHPWAKEGRVNRGEMLQQNFILYLRQSFTFRLIEEYFAHEQLSLKSFIELGNIEAMKELVKLGLGVTILPEWVALKELREGTLCSLPLGRRKLRRRWGILRHKHACTVAQQKFIQLCRNVAQTLNSEEGGVNAAAATPS